MSSIRDMFNSKLSNQKKQDVTLSKMYDESWLKITAVGGQTQLCPIKLNCAWAHSSIVSKPPALSCKWFCKTDISLTQIEGVYGTYYQPTLNDVGSKIQVQCHPQLQGVEYDGMPISIEVGPIKIDPQTQEQAKDFLQAKKSTFFIKIKTIEHKQSLILNSQGLLKLNDSKLSIISRTNNKNQKQLANIDINTQQPQFICTPVSPKLLTIFDKTQNCKIYIEFTNNKIRDVFILLVKLLSVQQQDHDYKQDRDKKGQNQAYMENSVKVQQVQLDHRSDQYEQKGSQKKSSQNSKVKSPQTSFQQLQDKKIGSSDDFKLSQKSNQFVSPPSFTVSSPLKSNTQDILQLSQLRKQIRSYQGQMYTYKKKLSDKDSQIIHLKQQIGVIEERCNNLNRNYFQLQNQLRSCKNSSENTNQQISYFRNQAKLLKSENQKYVHKMREYQQKIDKLSNQLQPYLDSTQDSNLTYKQLKSNYQYEKKLHEEFQSKCRYLLEDRQLNQDRQLEIVQKINKIQQQRDYYRKKYENLSAQLVNIQSQSISDIMTKNKNQIMNQNEQKTMVLDEDKEQLCKHMQQQILGLKKQLKQILQENDFLRSINMASHKDKKSSKTQLKLQLLETKKIVNRLTETVTEKDLKIHHLKDINKKIGEQLEQMRKKNQQKK